MKKRLVLLLSLLSFSLTAAFASEADYTGPALRLASAEEARRWLFVPAVNVGYNNLMNGYDGDSDLGKIGADLYIHFPQMADAAPGTFNNWWGRLSLEYFPLQVPDGSNGLTEDVYSLNGAFVYVLRLTNRGRELPLYPFLGLGGGWYQDRVELDTPASGKVTGVYNNFGWNASLGVFLPPMQFFVPIRLVPEVRYHSVKGVHEDTSMISYQLAVSFWPDAKEIGK